MAKKTEDEVRDYSKVQLGLDDKEKDVQQGTGQITTFNQLGFTGNINKPDGWYLPNKVSKPAIILETKSERQDISSQKWVDELLKNISIIETKYKNTIGILYNGNEIRVFRNKIELLDISPKLEHKSYYLKLCTNTVIDTNKIYNLTYQINNCLERQFGIKNLYHRMIFTACALVAAKEGAVLVPGMDYNTFHQSILSQINKSLKSDLVRNSKLSLLGEIYSDIKMNNPDNQLAINNFIQCVKEIADFVNSDNWKGEDVMGIFFNEFNRYRGKSESGQIFTPDHITSFMYRLIHCDKDSRILDATCGSGAFLVKAMCNMISEAGGINTSKATEIKQEQLFGIELDRQIFALACANMLIHKDGKTNLEQMDAREERACDWIKAKGITKVLMNPPYEKAYGCMRIVDNVLKSVPAHTECAFILPDDKLENDWKDKKYGNKLLKDNTLKKIIKLPEKLFFGVGVITSIYVFESGIPQNGKTIQGFYIEDDGLVTVKNKGRQDVKHKWQENEDKWIKIIENPLCPEASEERDHIQSIDPSQHLSYQKKTEPFEIFEEDFISVLMDFELHQRNIDKAHFERKFIERALFGGDFKITGKEIVISMKED